MAVCAFFERAEIRLAIAYLRVAQSPHDSPALLRMIGTPARGIGDKTIEQLQQCAAQHAVSTWEAILKVSKEGGRAAKALSLLIQQVQTLMSIARDIPFPGNVPAIVEASGLIDHYRNKAEEERVEHLYALTTSASSFDPEIWKSMEPDAPHVEDLALFLGQASLDTEASSSQDIQEAIQLMTVHAAKGLEFKQVAVVGLEEGLFPHENCQADEIEEERRLMYVAMTRAREQLILSNARSRSVFGQLRYGLPSRFLKELPSSLIEHYHISQWGDWLKNPSVTADTHTYPVDFQVSSASKAAPQTPNTLGFKKGQSVFHNTLGEGIILKIEPSGSYARLQIRFKRHGEKWLDSRYAPLAAV